MGKINIYDKIVMKKRKKYGNRRNLYKSPSKRRFWNGIYKLLKRSDARGSADAIYGM